MGAMVLYSLRVGLPLSSICHFDDEIANAGAEIFALPLKSEIANFCRHDSNSITLRLQLHALFPIV